MAPRTRSYSQRSRGRWEGWCLARPACTGGVSLTQVCKLYVVTALSRTCVNTQLCELARSRKLGVGAGELGAALDSIPLTLESPQPCNSISFPPALWQCLPLPTTGIEIRITVTPCAAQWPSDFLLVLAGSPVSPQAFLDTVPLRLPSGLGRVGIWAEAAV